MGGAGMKGTIQNTVIKVTSKNTRSGNEEAREVRRNENGQSHFITKNTNVLKEDDPTSNTPKAHAKNGVLAVISDKLNLCMWSAYK